MSFKTKYSLDSNYSELRIKYNVLCAAIVKVKGGMVENEEAAGRVLERGWHAKCAGVTASLI